MTPLQARGLHRFYRRGGNEVAALLDVSLSCGAGEIVAVEHGRMSFARLQQRMQIRDPEAARRSGVAVFLIALIPVAGYLEALVMPIVAVRSRRRAGEKYAGLRTLAK